jgi:hypothetical protein
MKVIGKQLKFLPWQITRVIDNFSKEKIQIKLFSRTKHGINFLKFQAIYCRPEDFEIFKKVLRARKRKS